MIKQSETYAILSVLWLIAASVQKEQDWFAVACMTCFVGYSIAGAYWVFKEKK